MPSKDIPYASPSTPIPLLPASKSPAAWLRLIIPLVLGLAVDLWLKSYAFPEPFDTTQRAAGIHPFDSVPLLPGVLEFQTTLNHGAVFGIGQGKGWLFVVFSFIALAAILFVFLRSYAKQWVLQLALGLITAGALGNLYDRIVYGCVRDMLHFPVKWYPYIFNIADVLLCVGVPLLMIIWIIQPEPNTKAKA